MMAQLRIETPSNAEPRWPAMVALIAVGGVYAALPPALTIGPRWLLLSIVSVLLVPVLVAHRSGKHNLNQWLSYAVNAVVTLWLIMSLVLLIQALPAHKETPIALLRSAAALWCTNVVVFALWYWRLDAGGPNQRDLRACHLRGAFLFPQMATDDVARDSPATTLAEQQEWSPNFLDYLFLSFNTSTAFSPTDAPVLARWAKVTMILQSMISLTIIVLLAARAVNIL